MDTALNIWSFTQHVMWKKIAKKRAYYSSE